MGEVEGKQRDEEEKRLKKGKFGGKTDVRGKKGKGEGKSEGKKCKRGLCVCTVRLKEGDAGASY